MGARVNGIHEVTGSIPVWSTNSPNLMAISSLLTSHASAALELPVHRF